MADSYGWTGKLLRVDLTAGTVTTESTEPYKAYMGGTGIGWKVLWDEVPPGTAAFDPENRLVFAVGPVTGSGSPCSGRTSIVSLWPVAYPELPSAGHMGGHWGPELKYAGYDGIIVQGASKNDDGSIKPVWLRIEDGTVTLEDAWEIWGTGIYRSTAYITNLMGTEAHVACIGQAGENQVRMAAVFTDRSHRAGGVGGIMGAKGLKAIGVRGTGAVQIAADKATWKELNNYYLSLMGANNQCVVARELQAWSEYSPGNTRWSGRRGLAWGAAQPPIDLGTCPDVEHPTTDAPSPINKIGLRTHKGYNDYGAEGQRRTVKMDGCHACPIRCHIAADHPELQSYGLNRYNMNTCMGNSGASWYTNSAGANPVSNPMMLAYMANNLEGDYGIWNDYGGWHYVFKWAYTTMVANPAYVEGGTAPAQITVLQKYLPPAEWTRLRTTPMVTGGLSPFGYLDAGDPRWMQFILAEVSFPKANTLGYYMGLGPPRLIELWPELKVAVDINPALHMLKKGHTSHHGPETQAFIGAMISAMTAPRDCNTHTHQNFSGNGLPNSAANPLQQAIAQEIATDGKSMFSVESVEGEWAWDLTGTRTAVNPARASIIVQSMIMYEVQNSLTECNYTLPVWASPLKSRKGTIGTDGYRGDPSLSAQVLSAVTGQAFTQKDMEKIGLRNFTLMRALFALHMEHWTEGQGQSLRDNFDQIANWCFSDKGTTTSSAFILDRTQLDAAKNYCYALLGFDQATGLPTQESLTALGLDFCIPTLQAAGLIP